MAFTLKQAESDHFMMLTVEHQGVLSLAVDIYDRLCAPCRKTTYRVQALRRRQRFPCPCGCGLVVDVTTRVLKAKKRGRSRKDVPQ